MAKRKNSAAKIAHGRRKTKSKRKASSKKRTKVKAKTKESVFNFPQKKILVTAVALFVFGYGSTWAYQLFDGSSESGKEVSDSVLTTLSEPSLFDKITDRLLDRDLPGLEEKKKQVPKKTATANKAPEKKIQAAAKNPLRAPLRELKISEERKIKTKGFSKDHLSKNDKAELDKILSKYGF